MKKSILALAIVFFGAAKAQVKFGINGGFSSEVVSAKFDDLKAGYYAGLFYRNWDPGFYKTAACLELCEISE